MSKKWMSWGTAVGLTLLGLGCQPVAERELAEAPDGDLVGRVSLALTAVPSDVQCVRVQFVGDRTATRKVPVAGGDQVLLDLGRLPLGDVMVYGNAYNTACNALDGQELTYVADPISVTLQAGKSEPVELTFRRNEPVQVDASFVGNVEALAIGPYAPGLLLEDGTLWTRGTVSPPLTNITAVEVGGQHGCAIVGGTEVWCWGRNSEGQTGADPALGFYSNSNQVDFSGVQNPPSGFAEIHVSYGSSCALATDKRVFCWGENRAGMFGNGTTNPSHLPTVMQESSGSDARFSTIDMHNDFVCGLNFLGSACCAGSDLRSKSGGNGDSVFAASASSCVPLRARAIALGGTHGCAIRTDDTVACWGSNFSGELGGGDTVGLTSATPVIVSGLDGVVDLAAGEVFNCAVRDDGDVYCWGDNTLGQIGADVAAESNIPVHVLSGANRVDAGWEYACAELFDADILCWGSNGNGQIDPNMLGSAWDPIPLQR